MPLLADHASVLTLGISLDVVKKHVGAICEKLGAANRAEAAVLALKRQLIGL